MRIFSKQMVGVEVSDREIRVALLSKEKEVVGVNRVPLLQGVVVDGLPQDRLRVLSLLTKALEVSSAKKISLVLPQSILRIVHLELLAHPHETIEAQKNRVVEALMRRTGISKDELQYVYEVVRTSADFVTIVAVVAREADLNEWQEVCREAGFEIESFVPELLALQSALSLGENDVIIDIGLFHTTVGLSGARGLGHAHTLLCGGNTITEVISEALGISRFEAQALQKKKDFLLSRTKAAQAGKRAVGEIAREIKGVLEYYVGDKKAVIGKVALVGEVSDLDGLSKRLQSSLGVVLEQVSICSAYLGQETPKKVLHHRNRVVYMKAVGGALVDSSQLVLLTKRPQREFSVTWNFYSYITALALVSLLFISSQVFLDTKENRNVPVVKVVATTTTQVIAAAAVPPIHVELPEVKEEPLMIEVSTTQTGWLRVRQGPGTNFDEIARVYTGERYPLIEEKYGWFKIAFTENTTGWVYTGYAIRLDHAEETTEVQ